MRNQPKYHHYNNTKRTRRFHPYDNNQYDNRYTSSDIRDVRNVRDVRSGHNDDIDIHRQGQFEMQNEFHPDLDDNRHHNVAVQQQEQCQSCHEFHVQRHLLQFDPCLCIVCIPCFKQRRANVSNREEIEAPDAICPLCLRLRVKHNFYSPSHQKDQKTMPVKNYGGLTTEANQLLTRIVYFLDSLTGTHSKIGVNNA